MQIQKVSERPFGNFREMWLAFRVDPLFRLFRFSRVACVPSINFPLGHEGFLYAWDKMADTVGSEGKIKQHFTFIFFWENVMHGFLFILGIIIVNVNVYFSS